MDFMDFGDMVGTGVLKVMLDPYLTILYGNDIFYNMTGYTRTECGTVFDNRLKNLVSDEDLNLLIKRKEEEKNGIFASDFRIQHPDGTINWLMIHAKRAAEEQVSYPVYYCIVTDITEFKKAQQKLEIEEERYRIISDISNDINFEYDYQTDTMHFSEKYRELYGQDPVMPGYVRNALDNKHVAKRDYFKFLELFDQNVTVSKDKYTEIRLNLQNRGYEWYGVYHTGIYDEYGKFIKIIGRIINIDRDKKEKEYLILKSQLDTMTKLLNKKTTEHEVANFIAQGDMHGCGTMFIIDVDNFKQINDTRGHLFGDSVLIEVARSIKENFSTKDIVGRIGGDEFMVFMKDVTDNMQVRSKALNLCERVKYLGINNKWGRNLSVSVGIAKHEEEQVPYKELFERADGALYEAKRKGKNCFEIYEREKVH